MAQQNKTEKPSPKKLKEAREQGNVARSREIPSALVYLGVFGFFTLTGSHFLVLSQAFLEALWRQFLTAEITPLSVGRLIAASLGGVMKLAGPLIALTLVVSLAGSLFQGKPVFAPKKLRFKPQALNPAKNVKKVFSKRGLVELAKAVFKIVAILWIAWSVLSSRLPDLVFIPLTDVKSGVAVFGEALWAVALRVGIFLAAVAALDMIFQKYRHAEELKQTRQEVRQDLKELEGDPLVKGRIRKLQRQMARRRMMEAVKTADVVVTNPTHYAVALGYNLEKMAAPRVVAKGRGHLAVRIREIAEEAGVPVVENVPLAQALYRSVEVDQEIPADLYRTVAQILAYVYSLKQESWH